MVDLSDTDISGKTPAKGAVGAGTGTIDADGIYDFVGIGGGGGGGGGTVGGAGSSGDLTVDDATLTVNRSILVGGAGGGAGIGGAGGDGGAGTLAIVNDGALAVSETLLIGGSAGGGAGAGAVGGNGGAGEVSVDATSSISIGAGGGLVIGGADGQDGLGTAGGTGGTGTLNLGGSLTLGSGATFTINAGSSFNLGNAVAGGASAGTLSGVSGLTNDGVINFNQSDSSYTFAAGIGGTGRVVQAGGGTTTLSGANTYSGTTTVSAGTLAASGGSAIGDTSAVTVASGATLAVNAEETIGSLAGAGSVTLAASSGLIAGGDDTSTTFTGAIGGAGFLTKQGIGTLTLSGANTYSGTTTVSVGTLVASGGSAIGDLSAVTVASGATLTVNAEETIGSLAGAGSVTLAASSGLTAGGDDSSTTFSGTIAGAGGLTKTGDGLLILTGTNTFTGVTTISAGTLQIGDGGTTGSLAGDVVNNASLVFDRSDTYAFTDAITGSGAVTFTGGGTVLFSASYTGAVTVDDSTVQLASGSSNLSAFTLNDGGVLGGTAAIGGLTVNAGGLVGPGYSPGTLTVNGPVAFNAGSVYQVEVNAEGEHDLILATGAVTLSSDASVEVLASPGRYPSTSQIAILSTTGTVTGTFGSVTSDFAFLDPELTYDMQNVFLTLVYNGFTFTDYAHTPNEASVAVAAQALGTGNAVFEAIFALPEGAVAPALDQLSGEIHASALTVIQQQSIYLRDAVGSRLRQSLIAPSAGALSYAAKAAGPATAQLSQGFAPTLWAEGFGGWGETSGNGNAASISTTVGGVFGGIDVAVLDHLRVGLVGGYSRTSFDVDARSSQGSMDNYDIGLYAGAQFDALALRGGASYTWHDMSVSRAVVFPGYYGSNDGDDMLGTTQLFGEIGYDLSVGAYAFEPFVGLAYVHISGDNLTESGTLASALAVEGASQSTFYSTLGVRAATTFTVAGRTLTPSATLGWQHAFGDTTSSADMLFASGGTTAFTIQGVPIAEDVALVGFGLGYQLSDSAQMQFNYAGQLADQANQNSFSAQFSLKF
ncbi:autotransporter domain-containing protein [Ancylobacter sp. TS-1]|uniref:autotransporter outer membrane beta-barrel domain-containing protein n=1 Tax=Ancylobacter sp. TS-1 TaxID=1850374 RepID=UPI0013909E02|nr:autotransporter domain-containing protein [Ancylobacter sp. TS-1]